MPGTRCAVATCSNSLYLTKKKNLNISYHRFPKDPKLCKVWINFCRRKDKLNPKTSTICSVHFLEEDFEVDLRNQLMNIKTKRKLKTSAIPTRCLNGKDLLNASISKTPRQVRANKRHNAALVKELLSSTEDDNVAKGDQDKEREVQDRVNKIQPLSPITSIEEKYLKLLIDHEKLKTNSRTIPALKMDENCPKRWR